MKHRVTITVLAALAVALGGCETTPKTTSDEDWDDIRWGGLDLGDDWIDEADSPLKRARAAERTGKPGAGPPTSYWAIVLGTYSDEGHAAAATRMIASMGAIDPRLTTSHVHTTSKGSMVLFGAYDGVEDDQARDDLAWVKGLQLRGRLVFPRAMLSRISAGVGTGTFAEHELLSVRERYPDIDPLYTLQVGVWGEFGGDLEPDELRRRAELQVRRLRSSGYDAYVHHDVEKGLSMVTIGLFDHTAIDGETNLYAPEVEFLFEEFPAHLVNGEPFKEPIDKRRPKLGTRIQSPRLVLVPTR